MKVLFVSRLFHDVSGGVERMAIAMMNEMCRRGHDIELLSWDRGGAETYYPLDERVSWHRLDMGDATARAGWILRMQRQWAIRRLLQRIRPDAVIAFQQGPFITVATAALGLGIPVIAAERNAPHRFDHLQAGKRRNLIFQTFRLADRITVQMDDYIGGYPAYLRDRIVSIPNPVRPPHALARPGGEEGQVKRLLSVGRLSYQKNQTVLVEAFALLAASVPDWNLVLVGAGEDERKLRQLVADKGLMERVQFAGAVKDVERFYVDSHLFCLSSRWEGFPNALAEAMAHGLPVVGYAGCAGVGQLIADGVSGYLAQGNGSVATLAEVLLKLMTDDRMRMEMGAAAAASMEKYAPQEIFTQWENLFLEVSSRS